MLQDFFSACSNFQPVKEIAVVNSLPAACSLILKETANHKLIQRLAKTPRTHEQSYHRLAFDQALYHQGFIDEVSIFINNLFEILHAYRNLLFSCIAHFFALLSRSLCFRLSHTCYS